MFFQWSTWTFGIFMEFKQTFRKCSVVESGSFEKGSYYSFVITFFHQPRNIFSGCTLTSYIQVVEESKIPDSVEECLLKLCSRFVILCGQKLEQILEHTTGSARSRNKLHDDFIRILISILCHFFHIDKHILYSLHNCPPSRPLPQPDQSLYCLFHSQSVTVLTSLHADSAEISAVG